MGGTETGHWADPGPISRGACLLPTSSPPIKVIRGQVSSRVTIKEDHQLIRALGDLQLVAFDSGERFEGRTGRPPAARAMAVGGVDEFVRHRVVDAAA